MIDMDPFEMRGGNAAADRRLYLKCCGAQRKEECAWAPCPANIDQWSPEELRQLISEDAHRVDDAVEI